MTEEKRKRGRPKKVKPDEGNAPKIQTFAPIYPSDTPVNDPVSLSLPEGVTEISGKGRPDGLAINADKFKPLPDNWFSLSKVDKLQWLTANPR